MLTTACLSWRFPERNTVASLGIEIKKARIERGWKQQDLLRVTGLSQKYLSQIEGDHVDPRWSIVKRIAAALEVSLDQLATARKEVPHA